MNENCRDNRPPISPAQTEEDLRRIAGMISAVDFEDPPAGLIEAVMAQIRLKKPSFARRLARRLLRPVTFSPLRAAPLGLLLVFLVVAAWHLAIRTPTPSIKGGPEKGGKAVLFTLNMPGASKVELVGSFNRWKPGTLHMRWDEERKLWALFVELEKGRHAYAFLVDGKNLVSDPSALLGEEDGFGNRNSILVIEGENNHETSL